MFGIISVIVLIGVGAALIKEACAPTIPAENWANKDLYHKDHATMSMKEIIKHAESGRYRLPQKTYPEPHRLPDGRIIIENNLLYEHDIETYGYLKAKEWVQQGKYNLTPEELRKENMRLKKEYENLGKL